MKFSLSQIHGVVTASKDSMNAANVLKCTNNELELFLRKFTWKQHVLTFERLKQIELEDGYAQFGAIYLEFIPFEKNDVCVVASQANVTGSPILSEFKTEQRISTEEVLTTRAAILRERSKRTSKHHSKSAHVSDATKELNRKQVMSKRALENEDCDNPSAYNSLSVDSTVVDTESKPFVERGAADCNLALPNIDMPLEFVSNLPVAQTNALGGAYSDLDLSSFAFSNFFNWPVQTNALGDVVSDLDLSFVASRAPSNLPVTQTNALGDVDSGLDLSFVASRAPSNLPVAQTNALGGVDSVLDQGFFASPGSSLDPMGYTIETNLPPRLSTPSALTFFTSPTIPPQSPNSEESASYKRRCLGSKSYNSDQTEKQPSGSHFLERLKGS